MTEYEIATLASRTLGHWIAAGQVAATIAIGIAQVAVVWFGIRAVQRAGDQRARDQDQRHAETMDALAMQRRALETLIVRTAPSAN